MCGFVGGFQQNSSILNITNSLREGLNAIRHRGPDSSDEILFENSYLGHNRLSIIDLSNNANQPFASFDKKVWMVFNGEIYNYKELKSQLAGSKFRTTSDTEVLLEGYIAEGVSFFKKLRGIYAFAILDFREALPKIILLRDTAGIKPLYYYFNEGLLIFGSEIKALLPSLKNKLTQNESIIKSYLNLSYCLEPYTAYKEINALEPGFCISLTPEKFEKYALTQYNFDHRNNYSLQENIKYTKELLNQAVSRNLVSDVDVTVALSGGIDSSLVYAISNKLHHGIQGISIKFNDEKYDESEVATSFAKKLNGKQLITSIEDDFNLEKLEKLLLHFDQPYADTSAIPVYYLTQTAGKFSKVLLGGDGGDELFNGYASQMRLAFLYKLTGNKLLKFSSSNVLGLLKAFSKGDRKREIQRVKYLVEDKPDEMIYDIYSWFPRQTHVDNESVFKFDSEEGFNLYNNLFADQSPHEFINKITFANFKKEFLSDYLRKTEMMSMLNSVEYRVPLLDEDLANFAFSIPFEQKASLKESKKILRNIHSEFYHHEGSKAPKKGFSIPLDRYLSKDEFNYICNEIVKPDSIVGHYIKPKYVKFLLDVITGKINGSESISRWGVYQRIIILYSLHIWHKGKNINV